MKISRHDEYFIKDMLFVDRTLLDAKKYVLGDPSATKLRADALNILRKYIPYASHNYVHVNTKKDYRQERFTIYTAFDLYCASCGYSLADKFYFGCIVFNCLHISRQSHYQHREYTGESPLFRFIVDYGGMRKNEHRFMDILNSCSPFDRNTIFKCLSRRYQHLNSISRRDINMFDEDYTFVCDLNAPSAPLLPDEEDGICIYWRPVEYKQEVINWVNGDAVDVSKLVMRSANPHTGEWLESQPEHECLPDYSCCSSVAAWDKETRKAFAEASPENRQDMLMNSLSNLVAHEFDDDGDPKVHVVDGKGDEHALH